MVRTTIATAAAILLLASCNSGSDPATGNVSANAVSAAPSEAQTTEPAAMSAAGARPSFACAKASSGMEKLVCDDGQLAVLDREVARLYGLAEAGAQDTPAQLAELRTIQRGWIKGRDDCWKSDDKRTCLASAYAQRVSELRESYAEARDQDANGISTGPMVATCEGIDAAIGVTFVKTQPGIVYLQWLDRGVALFQQRSSSGVRYTGTSFDGDYVFWEKGKEAFFTRPGAAETRCRIEEIG